MLRLRHLQKSNPVTYRFFLFLCLCTPDFRIGASKILFFIQYVLDKNLVLDFIEKKSIIFHSSSYTYKYNTY